MVSDGYVDRSSTGVAVGGWERSARTGQLLGFAAPVVSIFVELMVCHYDNPARVGGLGLITETPWPVFLLALMLSTSFALLLRAGDLPVAALMAHVAALAFLLPGLPGLLEQYPRFSTAWLHVGFVQAIIIHQHPIVDLDARFSWPGFFTGIAAIVGMAHLGTALPLLRWTPLVLNLAYSLPVFIIARTLLSSTRQAWVVTWLFILANWVGQDYFSPQGMAYFIFLSTIAVVLVGFPLGASPPGGRKLSGLITRFGAPLRVDTSAVTRAQQAGLVSAVMLAVIALSMEHQLTPVALAGDMLVLTIARQTNTRFLAPAVVLSIVGWIAYGAVAFWAGHLYSTLFGSGGSQAVQATVTDRITGSTGHELVVYLRVAFTLGVWGSAGLATLWGGLRKAPVPLTAIILAFVPFTMLAVQSYGGEAALRVYLYTLPFMLILIVAGFAGRLARSSVLVTAAIALGSTIMVPLLLIARFGNEQFEQVTRGDVAAARYVYSIAPPGSAIASVGTNALLGYKGLAAYSYPPKDLAPGSVFTTPAQILAGVGQNRLGTFLLITPAQIENAVVNDGMPQDWGTKLEARLAKNLHFKLMFDRYGARVYEVAPES